MAIREYIGARYVPRFMGTYDATQQYEALDVVDNGQGTSYISRKTTPAGTPLTDRNYWAIYGASSGAIINLQNQIDAANDRIDTILEDKIICIGDSYAVDATAGGTSWATRLKTNYGDRMTILREGGTGFTSDRIPSFSDNWLSMLTAHATGMTQAERDSVKQIVIVGGANDGNVLYDNYGTVSDLLNAITNFHAYAIATFPNAVIKLAFVGWHRQALRTPSYIQAIEAYTRINRLPRATYFASGEPIMHCNSFINTSDLVHPTLDASDKLAEFVGSMIENSQYTFSHQQDVTLTKDSAIIDITNITSIKAVYKGDFCQITAIGRRDNNSFIEVKLANASNIQIATGQAIAIGTVEGSPVGSNATPSFTPIHPTFGEYGGTSVQLKGVMAIQGNTLWYKHLDITKNASLMLIPWFTMNMNLRNN